MTSKSALDGLQQGALHWKRRPRAARVARSSAISMLGRSFMWTLPLSTRTGNIGLRGKTMASLMSPRPRCQHILRRVNRFHNVSTRSMTSTISENMLSPHAQRVNTLMSTDDTPSVF